jgi:hypothetical protein
MFLFLALGWLTVAFVGLSFFINGCFMLISPKAWFRLPCWVAARGPLTEAKYGRGPASMQIRLLGAIFIAFPVLCLMDFFFR